MKPQDIVFVIIIIALLIKRIPKSFVLAGLVCLIVAIPFFERQIFFTAQRLTLYAAVFFLSAIILFGFKNRK